MNFLYNSLPKYIQKIETIKTKAIDIIVKVGYIAVKAKKKNKQNNKDLHRIITKKLRKSYERIYEKLSIIQT